MTIEEIKQYYEQREEDTIQYYEEREEEARAYYELRIKQLEDQLSVYQNNYLEIVQAAIKPTYITVSKEEFDRIEKDLIK